jgi:hypothetical protein
VAAHEIFMKGRRGSKGMTKNETEKSLRRKDVV